MNGLDGFTDDATLYAEIDGNAPETLTANTDVDGDGDLDAEVHYTNEGNIIAYTDVDDDGRVDVIAGFDPNTEQVTVSWHADETGVLVRDEVPDASGSAAPVVPGEEQPSEPSTAPETQTDEVPEGNIGHTTEEDSYVTDVNLDLTGDGVDDAASWRNDDGTTVVLLDADGDRQADVAGVYDEQGRLIDTAHPDEQGVLRSDEQVTPAAFPSESFAVDPETGDWVAQTDH